MFLEETIYGKSILCIWYNESNKSRRLRTGVLGVSATGESGMDLDALTTALFVIGADAGIELANKLSIDVIYLMDNGNMFATNGFIGSGLNFQKSK